MDSMFISGTLYSIYRIHYIYTHVVYIVYIYIHVIYTMVCAYIYIMSEIMMYMYITCSTHGNFTQFIALCICI
jgi:hypothetical protein